MKPWVGTYIYVHVFACVLYTMYVHVYMQVYTYILYVPTYTLYRNLISLDLWRCKFASPQTIDTIASNCKDLEEMDIGWWSVHIAIYLIPTKIFV